MHDSECLHQFQTISYNLTLRNWVSRVSGIPGGVFGKLWGFSNIQYEIVGKGVGGRYWGC